MRYGASWPFAIQLVTSVLAYNISYLAFTDFPFFNYSVVSNREGHLEGFLFYHIYELNTENNYRDIKN